METPDHAAHRRRWLLRLALLAVLLATTLAGFLVDAQALFAEVHNRRFVLTGWVRQHQAVAIGLYIAAYVACVVLSLPGGVWLAIVGGFLFGIVAGTIYTVIGSTVGAVAAFLIARLVVGDGLRRRAVTFLGRVEPGFRHHALNYLIALRILPLFPFWVVNLVPALVGMRLRTYALGTFLGVIPGSIIFTALGAAFAGMLDRPHLTADMLWSPEMLLPLLGLAALALAPVIYAHLQRRQSFR